MRRSASPAQARSGLLAKRLPPRSTAARIAPSAAASIERVRVPARRGGAARCRRAPRIRSANACLERRRHAAPSRRPARSSGRGSAGGRSPRRPEPAARQRQVREREHVVDAVRVMREPHRPAGRPRARAAQSMSTARVDLARAGRRTPPSSVVPRRGARRRPRRRRSPRCARRRTRDRRRRARPRP